MSIIGNAIIIAETELGHGESTGNNRGGAIYRYRKSDGTGKPWRGRGDWCAAFASYCLRGATFDHRTGRYGELGFDTSRGARRLVRNIRDADPSCEGMLSGSCRECGLIAWKRKHNGRWHPWKGHVGLWTHYDWRTDTLYTIEGNHRKPGERRASVNRFVYPNGSWRKGLDRIVRL